MRCSKVVSGPRGLFPCGQCMPCRINSQRQWVSRLILESRTAPAIFVTLTYDWDHVPGDAGGAGLNLVPGHMQSFLKRLRERIRPRRIRFFGVGEYGSDPKQIRREKWPPWLHEAHQPRPHYHLVLFGLSLDECQVVTPPRGRAHIVHPEVHAAWGMGHTECDAFNARTARYISGYVLKKLTQRNQYSEKLLFGRQPEFIRTSRKPGLGAGPGGHLIQETARKLARDEPEAEDVPTQLRHDGKLYPFPKFVAAKVREARGFERLARNRPPRQRNPLDDQASGEFIEWYDPQTLRKERRELTEAERLSRERTARVEKKLADAQKRRQL